ncbi:MAG: hypothetical protein M0R03_08295 [Novosphingobium sp.]|nr:hypothetical protein [Novosphingobium sp.]
MSAAVSFLAPILALLPVAGTVDPRQEPWTSVSEGAGLTDAEDFLPMPEVVQGFRIASAMQVRIEQRMTIRIAPQSRPAMPNMLMSLPQRPIGPRFTERKIGKCLPISGIVGVQVQDSNRLLLFLRDQRMVSASLERACRSRDFYSGFYLTPTSDSQLCVDRDSLHSRNGANCKLSRIRQLVASDD